jgi:inhibitor of KinA
MNQFTDSDIRIYPLGDSAIVLEFGDDINEDTHRLIHSVCSFLDEYSFDGFVEYVPAFTTVTIFYDTIVSDYPTTETLLQEMLEEIMDMDTEDIAAQVIEIPVLYGGDEGPDLAVVAEHSGLTEAEVIAIHSSGDYLVHMIGFAPGFPYLGGLDARISAPRRQEPRTKVLAGSVGIAGLQTGVYPMETPGGWQIIGQTPLALFDVTRQSPALLKGGDKVRFIAIDALEFALLKGEDDGY